eukprot:1157217-Pelagomonas_calceolata.AAC.5
MPPVWAHAHLREAPDLACLTRFDSGKEGRGGDHGVHVEPEAAAAAAASGGVADAALRLCVCVPGAAAEWA